MNYTLQPLSEEEFKNLSSELTEVLNKYNAELGVKSTIEILKRVEKKEDVTSPYTDDKGEATETE